MQTFKKVVISSSIFVLVLVLVSAIIIEPMIQMGGYYYCDGKYRRATAGEYELLFMGDSDGLAAFNPSVFYEQSGIKSYNLSGEKNTGESEYYLLNVEIARNPVKEVILQVGIDTFIRDYSDEHGEGNAVTAIRTNNIFERASFLKNNVSFDALLDIYSKMLTLGILSWARNIAGNTNSNFDGSLKGWHRLESNDISLTKEEAKEIYNTEAINVEFRDDRIDEFRSIINLCKKNDINVTVVIVPMADWYLWKKNNCDAVHNRIYTLCNELDVRFVDFNLFKDRFSLFNDQESFKDSIHLSELGAEAFSTRMAEVFHIEEEQLSELFYDSYEAMKMDSPYAEFLSN